MCNIHPFISYRLVATYEEHQKLQKENEPAKRKAENGYDRWIMAQGWGHINTSFSHTSNDVTEIRFVAVGPSVCSYCGYSLYCCGCWSLGKSITFETLRNTLCATLNHILLILKLLLCSSQEPDSKRQRVDDASSAAANAMTDMQANNSAYNYNWYQVGYIYMSSWWY